jgi:tetrahydromethanopterin S-methyltransferase subunit G
MAGTSQGESARVTNAILLTRMDDVARRLDKIENKLDFVMENKANIESIDERLDKMETKSNRIDIFLTIGTIVGSVIGAIFGQQRL